MSKSVVACMFVLVFSGTLSARTRALWPLETLSTGALDGRCVIDPANDLIVAATNVSAVAQDIGWTLPPNPDSARHAWTPNNFTAFKNAYSGSTTKNCFYSSSAGAHVTRDKSFTVEGFVKILALPASNAWGVVMAGFDDAQNSAHRWVLSFRRRSDENYAASWILWANDGQGDILLHKYASEEASYALTNIWMHVSLVNRQLGNSQSTWSLYLDGAKVGEQTKPVSTAAPGGSRLSFGGRDAGNSLSAVFDYWRLSDNALEPSQFLNAGTANAAVGNRTIAYWPLGVTANDGVDGRDAVGESPLTSGFYNMSKFTTCRMGGVDDCAFSDNPPNPTVTLPNGNAGSLQGAASSANLQIDGAMLNLSQDFTVEGWFAPRFCERPTKKASEYAACYLFGTRADYGKGWCLDYYAASETSVACRLYGTDGSVFANNFTLTGTYDMAGWYETWHHLALTYDRDGGTKGFGCWTLYIDGVKTGSYENTRALKTITDSRPFFVGGRADVVNASFQGKIDCLRVCTAVLEPQQFLNAVNGTAASNVYGLWPLNVSNGVALDLRDVSGNNRHFANLDSQVANQQVTAVPGEAPVITNPDPTSAFRGDRTKANGCTRFRDVNGTNQHRSYLATGSSLVMDAVKGLQEYTFECYYKRERETTDNQECLFVVCNGTSAKVRIFRKSDGLYVWENLSTSSNLSDTKIPGTADADLAANTWYHLALVHTMESGKSMWRVYVNGTLKGSASQTAKTTVDSAITALSIGGRWFSDKNSVNGCLSSVRLSKGALDPSDFLCAVRKLPVETQGAEAYWPIDGSGIGLGNRIESELSFSAEGSAVAQDERARGRIPNAAALADVVTGASRWNVGSYAFGAAGALKAPSVGHAFSLTRSFTVEGWLKWTPDAGTADEDLVVAGNSDGHGVRLFIDKSGATPLLRVKGRGLWPCTPWIDTAFSADLAPFANTWTHLAVVYAADDFTGSWTLWADGKQLGTKIYNFYYPVCTDSFRSGDLRLGSTKNPLSGAVDMWRVSPEALDVTDMLYAPKGGLLIRVR